MYEKMLSLYFSIVLILLLCSNYTNANNAEIGLFFEENAKWCPLVTNESAKWLEKLDVYYHILEGCSNNSTIIMNINKLLHALGGTDPKTITTLKRLKKIYENKLGMENCPYSRNSAIECFEEYFDLNHDKIVQKNEIKAAISKCMSVWVRIISFFTQPIPKIMLKCDKDGDGSISRADFISTADQCMETCNSIKDMHRYFCDFAKRKIKEGNWKV